MTYLSTVRRFRSHHHSSEWRVSYDWEEPRDFRGLSLHSVLHGGAGLLLTGSTKHHTCLCTRCTLTSVPLTLPLILPTGRILLLPLAGPLRRRVLHVVRCAVRNHRRVVDIRYVPGPQVALPLVQSWIFLCSPKQSRWCLAVTHDSRPLHPVP
jgi:hypothetical protein